MPQHHVTLRCRGSSHAGRSCDGVMRGLPVLALHRPPGPHARMFEFDQHINLVLGARTLYGRLHVRVKTKGAKKARCPFLVGLPTLRHVLIYGWMSSHAAGRDFNSSTSCMNRSIVSGATEAEKPCANALRNSIVRKKTSY